MRSGENGDRAHEEPDRAVRVHRDSAPPEPARQKSDQMNYRYQTEKRDPKPAREKIIVKGLLDAVECEPRGAGKREREKESLEKGNVFIKKIILDINERVDQRVDQMLDSLPDSDLGYHLHFHNVE